jgi:hypothetical protein
VSPRLAADFPHYRMELIDRTTGQSSGVGVDLISVTSAIKTVMAGSFAPAAWWGYRVAAGAMLGTDDIYGEEAEDLYQKLKEGGVHPNSVRDAAGKRGTNAHWWMEMVATGKGAFLWEGGEPVAFRDLSAISNEVVVSEPLDGYGKAGAHWMHDYVDLGVAQIISAEQPLFSLKTLSGGTPDLLVKTSADGTALGFDPVLEIVDWKTHKPASPMTMKLPDGTKIGTPAYFEELVQLATYRGMYEEMTGLEVARQRVVVLRENGKYLEDTRAVPPSLFFDHILTLFHAMAGSGNG